MLLALDILFWVVLVVYTIGAMRRKRLFLSWTKYVDPDHNTVPYHIAWWVWLGVVYAGWATLIGLLQRWILPW